MLAFYEAIIRGDITEVGKYLRGDVELNTRICVYENGNLNYAPTQADSQGLLITPLHLAVLNRRINIAKLLVKGGALLEKQALYASAPDGTAFELAVKQQNFIFAGVLRDLGAIDAKKVLPNQFTFNKELDKAIEFDDVEAISQLYQWKLITQDLEILILHKAARYYAFNVLMYMLTNKNQNANLEYDGRTALIEAVCSGFKDGVSLLLYAGANPNHAIQIRNHRITSLDLALKSDKFGSKVPIINLLLRYNADFNQINETVLFRNVSTLTTPELELVLKNGFKPKPIAINSYVEYCITMKRFDLAAILCTYGMQLRKKETIDPSVLFTAIDYATAEELDSLLSGRWINPNITHENISLLESAVVHKRFDLAARLVNHGADISYKDPQGRSYLHRCGNIDFAKQLLARGLDINAVDSENKKALYTTPDNVAQYLIDKKNNVTVQHNYLFTQFHKPSDFGKPVLFQLAEAAWQPGNLNKLITLLTSMMPLSSKSNIGSLDINYSEPKNQWTALHAAFSSATLLDISYRDNNPNKRAIDFLIILGAKPKLNVIDCTPLMNMQYAVDPDYADILIDRYSKFEAEHYGFEQKSYATYLKAYYKNCSIIKNKAGFFEKGNMTRFQAIKEFWTLLDLTKTNLPKP